MYSKNLIWVAPLLVSLAACSSDGRDLGGAGTAGAGGSVGGALGVSGAIGSGTAGLPSGVGGAGAPSGIGGSGFGGNVGSAGSFGVSGGGSTGLAGSAGAGTGTAGATGTAGSGGGGVAPGVSGLPAPPGDANVAKPAGTAGTITVLNWAGFKGAVTYSFDDSNSSQISAYPTLQALGVPFTFFMWTGKSDASNAIWATAVKDGHEIGNHTMSHSDSACTAADVNAATTFIQSKLNVKAMTMAAPNGTVCFDSVAKGLFFINRGVQPAQPVMPTGSSDPFNLNCYIPAAGQATSVFNSNVDDGRSKGGWVIYVVHGFTGGSDSAYQPVALDAMTGAIKYTKSLPDMWIGTMVNVGAYWLGQRAFTAAMTAKSGTDTTYTWTLPGQFPTGKYLRVKVDGGTLKQKGTALNWDPHGYYEIALDAGSVTLSP